MRLQSGCSAVRAGVQVHARRSVCLADDAAIAELVRVRDLTGQTARLQEAWRAVAEERVPPDWQHDQSPGSGAGTHASLSGLAGPVNQPVAGQDDHGADEYATGEVDRDMVLRLVGQFRMRKIAVVGALHFYICGPSFVTGLGVMEIPFRDVDPVSGLIHETCDAVPLGLSTAPHHRVMVRVLTASWTSSMG